MATAGCGGSSQPSQSNVAACKAVKSAINNPDASKAPAELRNAAGIAVSRSLRANILEEAHQASTPNFSESASVAAADRLQRSCDAYGVNIGLTKKLPKPEQASDPNIAALRMVRAFDTQPNPSPPDGDWARFVAPLEKAARIATDQTLSADILAYSNNLMLHGTDAYTGQPLTTLIDYAKAVYHFDVFPGG